MKLPCRADFSSVRHGSVRNLLRLPLLSQLSESSHGAPRTRLVPIDTNSQAAAKCLFQTASGGSTVCYAAFSDLPIPTLREMLRCYLTETRSAAALRAEGCAGRFQPTQQSTRRPARARLMRRPQQRAVRHHARRDAGAAARTTHSSRRPTPRSRKPR